MAVEWLVHPRTYLAGTNLSGLQFRFVKMDTVAGRVALPGTGEQPVGVMLEGATTNAAVAVTRAPAAPKVVAGATLTAGQKLATNAEGKAIPWAAGYAVVGWAETASATSGIVTVSLATFGGTA